MSVMTYRRQEFPNRFKFACLIVSISGSNPLLEGTFSFLINVCPDKRLSMHQNTINKSFIIYGNDDLRSREKREAIVHRAVQIYMESKERIKNGPPATKK